MNFFQKRFLTLAAFIANISLTLVVAGVATYAWFSASASITAGNPAIANVISSTDIQVDKEFLNFNDNSKAGETSPLVSDFKLKDYDKYIGQKNKYTNTILRATLSGSWTSSDDIYVDITCQDNHAPSNNPSRLYDYTSNVAQFKVLTASYLLSGDSQRTPTGVGIADYDSNNLASNAATRYRAVTNYFETTGLPGTRFVALHNNRLYKPSNKITLLAPSLGLTTKQTATQVTLYIECSYNKQLAGYYNGPIKLEPDITEIKFYTGSHKTGAYTKVKSSSDVATGNQYMVTYDGFTSDDLNPAFDGSASSFDVDNNYRDVYVRANRIPYTAMTEAQDFSYASGSNSDAKLVSRSGKTIGLDGNGEYTSGTGYIGDDDSYRNTMEYHSDTSKTTIQSDEVSSRYLKFNPNSTHFKYYDTNQHDVGVYKYDAGAAQFLVLQSLTLSTVAESSPYGEPWTYPGRVYANYGATADGVASEVVDVTAQAIFSKAKIYEPGNQNITISYTDPYYGTTKSATCELTITNATVSLSVDTSNAKLYYIQNTETYTKTGLIVTAHKTDGSSIVLTESQYSCSGFDNSVVGNETITVSYTDETSTTCSTTYTVTIVSPSQVMGRYVKVTSLDDLHASDRVLITTFYNDETYYYLPSTTTGSNPTATSFTESSTDTITGSFDNYLFTVGKDNDDWTFVNAQGNYLHNNNSNTGVRINNTTVAPWTVTATSGGYKMTNNSRWLGVYKETNADWRSYDSSDASNYKGSGELINFYKKVVSAEDVVSIYIADTKKTNYYTSDTFVEPVVYAVYANNSYQLLTPSDYTKTPANPLNTDFTGPSTTRTVTISFGGESASYDITVTRRIPSSISVTGQTTSFYQGDTFTFGGTATITYNDGSEDTQTPDCSGYDMNSATTQTVTASYTSGGVTVTTTYSITVTARTPTGISLDTSHVNTSFVVGDTFSYEGLVVTVSFNVGDDSVVTPTSVVGPDMSTAGSGDDKTVTVSYTANNTTVSETYTITVNAAALTISGDGVVAGTPKTKTAVIGMDFTFTASVTRNQTIYWESSDDTKVSVSPSSGTEVTLSPLAKTTSAVTITAYAFVNSIRVEDTVAVTVNYPTVTLSLSGAQTIYNSGTDNSFKISAESTNGHQISWTTSPAGKVTLSSSTSDSGISADNEITVTAVAAQTGDVTLTAHVDGASSGLGTASITIHVNSPVTPNSLSIKNGDNVTTAEAVSIGDTLQLTPSANPAPTYPAYIWESNNAHITVTQSGLVSVTNSATAGETATITLYFDANGNGVKDLGESSPSAQCVITARQIITGTFAVVSKSTSTYYSAGDTYGSMSGNNGVWETAAFTLTQYKNSATNAVNLTYDEIRIYIDHTFVISAKANFTITSIDFTGGTDSKSLLNLSSDVGTYSGSSTSTTWTGTATSITFTPSAQARISRMVVHYSYTGSQTVSSIAVKTAPTTTSYEVGDNFDPTGLVITVTYNIGSPQDVAYSGNEGDFTFSPATNVSLQTSHTSVTITYGGKTCSQTISVTDPQATTYTVTYNANEGTGTMTDSNSPYAAGSNVTVLTNTNSITRDGYNFTGWNTQADGGGTAYANGATIYNIQANITLYAQWELAPSEHETSVTYTFTNNQWNYGSSSWAHSANGYAKDANRGVQLTTSQNNIIICSPTSYRKIQKVVVRYAANSSKGKGTIYAYYRSSSSTSTTGTLIGSTSLNRPGSTLKTTTFTPSSLSSTDYVQIKVAVTENSLYIYSIQVYYMATS